MTGNEARHHQAVKGKIYSKLGFVISDLCYILSENHYTNFWGKKHNYADGVFEIDDLHDLHGSLHGSLEDDLYGSYGLRFAVGSTAHGDGVYFDNEAHKYPVDAGNIALIPLELVSKGDNLQFGTVYGIPGEAEFSCENGIFDIALPNGHKLHIDTRLEDIEDFDDYNEEEKG